MTGITVDEAALNVASAVTPNSVVLSRNDAVVRVASAPLILANIAENTSLTQVAVQNLIVTTTPQTATLSTLTTPTTLHLSDPFLPPEHLARYSVMRYGAKVDGVTDDTEAVQRAIDSGSPVLYFPAGNCVCRQLIPRSGQLWKGEGRHISQIVWAAQNETDTTLNLIASDGDLSDVEWQDLGFVGSLLQQTSDDNTGQNLAAFKLRAGSCSRIRWTRVLIKEWGSQGKNAGAGILMGPTQGTGKQLIDIDLFDVVFDSNANVPGIFISSNSSVVSKMERISVRACQFRNELPYARQNMVYIYGVSGNLAENVRIQDCTFDVAESIDTCIELNYVSDYSITDNSVTVRGSALATGFLLRSNAVRGIIVNNTLNNASSSLTDQSGAIVFVQQPTGVTELQGDTTVANNVAIDWQTAYRIKNVSTTVTFTSNIAKGVIRTTPVAFDVAGAANVQIRNNLIDNCRYALNLDTGSSGLREIFYEDNKINNCGDGVVYSALVATANPNVDAQGVIVRRNIVTNVVAGTGFFASLSFIVATGNRVLDNTLPATLGALNPSYTSSVEQLIVQSKSSGNAAVERQYYFDQGGLPWSPGVQWVIGGNLDSSAPDVTPGDVIIGWGFKEDATGNGVPGGIQVTPSIVAPGVVRLTTYSFNTTAAVGAGRWFIRVMRMQ